MSIFEEYGAFNIPNGIANSVDPDQTVAEAVWSGSALFAYAISPNILVYEILGHLPYLWKCTQTQWQGKGTIFFVIYHEQLWKSLLNPYSFTDWTQFFTSNVDLAVLPAQFDFHVLKFAIKLIYLINLYFGPYSCPNSKMEDRSLIIVGRKG